MLKSLNVGEKAELYVMGKEAGFTLKTSIADYHNDVIILSQPLLDGVPSQINKDYSYTLVVHQDRGIYQVPLKFIERKDHSVRLYLFRKNGSIKKIQRREFCRFKVNFDGYIRDMECENAVPSKIKIEDISAGGLKVSTQHVLPLAKDFLFSFVLPGVPAKKIECVGNVVRKDELSLEGLNIYGVCFNWIEEGDADAIFKFIFQKEMERREVSKQRN